MCVLAQGPNIPLLPPLPRARVRVVGQRDHWYKVVLPPPEKGRLAWIYKSLVSVDGR